MQEHITWNFLFSTRSDLNSKTNSVERGFASTPLFIISAFSFHFPLELSYGFHRFEGNGKIPLGRQGKRSLKGREKQLIFLL